MTQRIDPTVIETPDERLGHRIGNLTMALYPLFIVALAGGMLMRHGWWAAAALLGGTTWALVIIVSLIICWRPARWTVCTRWGRVRVQAHSAPDWLGVQSAGCAALSLFCVLPPKSGRGGFALEYLIPLALSVVALWLARVCYVRGKASGRGSLHIAYSELFTGKKV